MKKIHAGSLLLAIFISFIIATMAALLLLQFSYYAEYLRQTGNRDKCNDLLNSSVALVLGNKNAHFTTQSQLFKEEAGETNIQSRNWGIFSIATVRAMVGKDTLVRSLMTGGVPDSVFNACLYLEEHNKPLLISGNTVLNGNVYLPKSGVNPTYLDKDGFTGKQLYNGQLFTSTREIKSFVNLESLPDPQKKIKQGPSDHLPLSIRQSFSDTVLHLYTQGRLANESSYAGQIIICADSVLTVPGSCSLENVILMAPYIKIESGFRGSVQAIATDSLITGQDCFFEYPSALVLLKPSRTEANNFTARLQLGAASRLNGTIFTYTSNSSDLFRIYTHLGNQTKVMGIVYSDGYLEINGSITGTLLTAYTILKHQGSIYDNRLHNTSIDRNALSSHYLLPAVLDQQQSARKVLQWLN
ncbi:hypothetical protein [Chitinophaga sp. HK235]|uniref:hypothetical protein n=1 Tax=Chitinophaga sp. HK235 TaxID=2952571 RepID=UPI001BACF318|nr:hypothetical protein [Chitinophaga sp. HK235]